MTKEQLQKYCTEELIENEDGSFSTKGNVNLNYLKLTELPKFREVGGWFDCGNNKLISLKGSPREVGEWFDCSNNKLKNLRESPEKVGGRFDCSNNYLSSLKDSPRKIGGWFYYSYNSISEEKLLITRCFKRLRFVMEKLFS